MYKLWCLAIYGFIPKWDILSNSNIVDKKGVAIGRVYTLQCEQTGSIKFKKVRG